LHLPGRLGLRGRNRINLETSLDILSGWKANGLRVLEKGNAFTFEFLKGKGLRPKDSATSRASQESDHTGKGDGERKYGKKH